MNQFKEMISKFVREEDGVTAVEYGVMLAFIAVGLIIAVGGLRDAVEGTMDAAAAAINGEEPAAT